MSSSRGKMPGRPNLALAGKKEDVKKASTSSESRGRGRGGGGRGRGSERGRGRGGSFHKPELIQTSGVFSEGLGGDFPSRSRKDNTADTPVFNVLKKGPTTKKPDDAATDEEKKEAKFTSSFKGWDDLWCSDGEDEDEILKSLLPKGIMSDYTRGTILPLVLPKDDESQFVHNMHRKVKQEIMSDDEEGKAEAMDTNETKEKLILDSIGGLEQHDPTFKYSRKAAQAVNSTEQDTDRPDFFLLQLPSIIGTLCRTQDYPRPEPVVKMEIDAVEDISMMPEESTSDAPDDVVPAGQKIGKLMITKRGKVLLKIGDHIMDVTKTLSGGQREAIVLLETEKHTEVEQQVFGGMPTFIKTGENALYHIGTVKHHLMASIVWNGLNEKKQETELDGNFFMDTEAERCPDLAKQLQQIEKQQKSWISLVESSADGS